MSGESQPNVLGKNLDEFVCLGNCIVVLSLLENLFACSTFLTRRRISINTVNSNLLSIFRTRTSGSAWLSLTSRRPGSSRVIAPSRSTRARSGKSNRAATHFRRHSKRPCRSSRRSSSNRMESASSTEATDVTISIQLRNFLWRMCVQLYIRVAVLTGIRHYEQLTLW